MTRIKKGLDYFCFPTDTFNDLKIKRLRRLCGNNGVLVSIYLVNEAYRVIGYALNVSEELIIDIADNFRIEEKEVQHIMETCCKVEIFDAGIYRKCGVLTSAEIQERFLATCRKLGRRNVEIVSDILLIEDKGAMPVKSSQSSEKQTVMDCGEECVHVKSETKSAEISPQRKERKRNEKNREEKKPHPIIPSPESVKGEESVRPAGPSAGGGGYPLRQPLGEVLYDGVSADAPLARAAEPVQRRASGPSAVPPGSVAPIGSLMQASGIDPTIEEETILPDPHTPCPRGEGRNYWGMVEALQRFRLPVSDINNILRLSNFGEIGDPAWRAIYEINNSGGTIKYPAKYIYSVIQKARKRQEGGVR